MNTPSDKRERLQSVLNVIRSGNLAEARELLRPMLKEYPNNAELWFTAALATESRPTQIRLLKQSVRLDPVFEPAARLLDDLETQQLLDSIEAEGNASNGQSANIPRPASPTIRSSAIPDFSVSQPASSARSVPVSLILLGICASIVLAAVILNSLFSMPTDKNAALVLGQPDFTSGADDSDALTPRCGITLALGQPLSPSHSSDTSRMAYPSGIAIDPTTDQIFVSDNKNNRILRFANFSSLSNGAMPDGVLGQPDFTSNSAAVGQSGMASPCGVAVDSNGNLWVTDTYNNRVLRFDHAASKANGAPADGVLGEPDFFKPEPGLGGQSGIIGIITPTGGSG